MHNPFAQKNPESPFFDLLADAEDIKIREVSSESPEALVSTTLRSFKDFGKTAGPTQRTFLVHVRAKITPPPTNVPEATAPENRTYLLHSAELLMKEKDYLLARNIFSYLLKSNIRDPESLRGLGIAFLRLGEITSAKKCFRALIELGSSEDSLVYLGQCLALENDDNGALEAFARVKSAATLPKHVRFDLFKESGNCLTRLGKWDEAWKQYHLALECDPTADAIFVNLGTLESQRRNPTSSASYYHKALELNPNNPRAHCGLGCLAIQNGDLALASRELGKTLDLDSQSTLALYQLIQISQSRESLQALKLRLANFLNKDSKNPDIRYALAAVFYKEGDWKSCERELSVLLTVSPDHAKGRQLREDLNSNKHRPI